VRRWTMIETTERTIILDQPLVGFGREVCGDLDAALRREWLVTNGLGGYVSGTLAGINTRRYHGLLVAALEPPVARTVMVSNLIEWIGYDGKRYPLFTQEYGDGTIDGHGYRHLQSFRLEGSLPVWTYAIADALIERRIWMAYGANTTYISYNVLRATRPLELDLTPLVTYRDFHALGSGPQPTVDLHENTITIRAGDNAQPFSLIADKGNFRADGAWWYNFHHREEAARGLDTRSDLYAPGAFTATLDPGESYTLVLTTEENPDLDADRALDAERSRQLALLERAAALHKNPSIQQLVLAADQFIVRRTENREQRTEAENPNPKSAIQNPKSVIAGYHWFNDWGRDTMIALPGLALATNRSEDAATILRTFARYVRDGLLPNNFPDSAGVIPGYNTVDATLWYIHAIRAYHAATGDDALVDDLLLVLRDIIDRHIAGTRYGIGVDPADGLLRAGEAGVQLTWMDAKVGEYVVTPRIGKPVEINALWFNALRTIATFLAARHDPAAQKYDQLANQVHASFRARFLDPDRGYLADVIDGPDGDDWTFRPNQIFAISLPEPLLDGDEACMVVDAVGRELLTSYGLRSLNRDHPAYRGDYGGDAYRRDTGYHQGPVWTWLIGAFVEAHYRVYGDRDAAIGFVQPFTDHLRDACLGSISEILEGDPPHTPRGCVAQAWAVAEVLRVWRLLDAESLRR
jgi:predicted glycogen debranching enzyme